MNMEVFEMYLHRNLLGSSTTESLRRPLLSKDSITKELDAKQLEIDVLVKKLRHLRNSVVTTSHQCEQAIDLHSSLNKVLYSLRVGAQSFVEYDVSPIDSAISSHIAKRNELSLLISRSEGNFSEYYCNLLKSSYLC